MSNPLYSMLGGAIPNNLGNIGDIVRKFQQFRNSFNGDPRQQVQQLLNSGRVSQEQYNQAVQIANQLQKIMK